MFYNKHAIKQGNGGLRPEGGSISYLQMDLRKNRIWYKHSYVITPDFNS